VIGVVIVMQSLPGQSKHASTPISTTINATSMRQCEESAEIRRRSTRMTVSQVARARDGSRKRGRWDRRRRDCRKRKTDGCRRIQMGSGWRWRLERGAVRATRLVVARSWFCSASGIQQKNDGSPECDCARRGATAASKSASGGTGTAAQMQLAKAGVVRRGRW
jgi:hypothetical protein